jgi:hypothetical protein
MSFAESDRVQLRRWLGYSAMYASRDPILESAITAAQSTADGGSRPDNATELAIKGWLTELATIETKIKSLYDMTEAAELVGDLVIDPARGIVAVRQVGRMYVGFISDALSTPPKRDAFSSPKLAT